MGAKKWMVGGAALLLAAACALTPSFARQENGQYIAAAVTTGSSSYTFDWAEEELIDPTPGDDETEIDVVFIEEEEESGDTLTATLTVSPPELPLLGAASELSYTVTLTPPSGGETAKELTLTAQVCNAAGETCEDVTCTVEDTEEENIWTVTLAWADADNPPAAGIYTLEISLSCTNDVFTTVELDQVFYVNHQTDLSGTITGTSISLNSDTD